MPLDAAFGGPNQLVKDSAGTVHVITGVVNGVYSARWDGAEWSSPERIDDRNIDPHGQNMVVSQGNQLHVVYYDRIGSNKVWYSSRRVEAPHIERRPLPKPTPQPTVSATPVARTTPEVTATLTSHLTATVVSGAFAYPSATTGPDPVVTMLVPIVPVLVLLTTVFVIQRRKGD
jgi:hypothetical protein